MRVALYPGLSVTPFNYTESEMGEIPEWRRAVMTRTSAAGSTLSLVEGTVVRLVVPGSEPTEKDVLRAGSKRALSDHEWRADLMMHHMVHGRSLS